MSPGPSDTAPHLDPPGPGPGPRVLLGADPTRGDGRGLGESGPVEDRKEFQTEFPPEMSGVSRWLVRDPRVPCLPPSVSERVTVAAPVEFFVDVAEVDSRGSWDGPGGVRVDLRSPRVITSVHRQPLRS